MQQQLRSRHLFMGGLDSVWTTSAASSALGLGGLLISSSFAVLGVWVPVGVGGTEGPLSLFTPLISSSSYAVGAASGGEPFRTAAGGPVMDGLWSTLMKAPKVEAMVKPVKYQYVCFVIGTNLSSR